MKKLIFVVTMVTLLALCLPGVVAVADTSADYVNSNTYQMLDDFLTKYPNRSGSKAEKEVAAYLVEQFNTLGYKTQLQQVPESYGYETYNAIGIKDNASSKECIVIGAHYDGLVGSYGANDNASGIVALLQIAQRLQSHTLDFDVIFVAFGGEEQGLFGSQFFVDNFSREFTQALADIRLMINIDSIAGGDNLYLHCENKSTTLANLFLANAPQTGATLLEKPYAVGAYNMDLWGYGYYETVQGSDHTPFRVANVPVANFFSGNFKLWEYVESTDKSKVTMNTAFDTFENLNKNRGAEWVAKIDTVVATVVSTVACADFATVSANARNELVNNAFWHNSLWPKLACGAIVIALVIVAIFHHRKLQKQALMGEADIKTTRIFETPDANDIFSFKD